MNYLFKYAFGKVSKLGNMFRTYTDATSCPSDCPLRGSGCYAELGPVSWVWKKLNTAGESWSDLLNTIKRLPVGTLWRHNVAGDLPHSDGLIILDAIKQLLTASKHTRPFTYTHHKPNNHNAKVIRIMNDSGFTVNLSSNNVAQADLYLKTKLPVVTLLPLGVDKVTFTPDGNKVIKCPNQSNSAITCDRCGLCADRDRSYIIGFEAHGSRKKTANAIALA